MKIMQTQAYNLANPSYKRQRSKSSSTNPQFTGKYDQLAEWIANNYYKRFYNSKFSRKFIENTKGPMWDNMTTHMSALGSTLISGMYIVKTLQNDKLDKEKRKTLALNDFMVWGLSTFGAYFMDSKLGNWWDGVTTRFAANYLLDNPESMKKDILGDWNPANLRKVMKEQGYKSIRDFNLDILKDKKLTTLIDGMGVLKSLFVFGMVYRYIVPVLVMKPANWIGNYYHKKQAEKAQAAQTENK
ncbi:hypothetical protein IJ579_09100 [bacterium]|nr:hypothetical protein [bacterium]